MEYILILCWKNQLAYNLTEINFYFFKIFLKQFKNVKNWMENDQTK